MTGLGYRFDPGVERAFGWDCTTGCVVDRSAPGGV